MEYNLLRKEIDHMKAESEDKLNLLRKEFMKVELVNEYHPYFSYTGGFHLYCILSFAGIYETENKFFTFCSDRLKSAIVSVALVFVQYMSLFILELEALLTTFSYIENCKMLNECARGYFCGIPEEKCVSCEYSSPTCSEEPNSETRESWDIFTVSVGIELSRDEYNCLSYSYCDDDFDYDVSCPYWESKQVKHSFNMGTFIVLIFVGIVLAYNIYKDINQVTIEEAFFNNFIDKSERRHMFAESLLKISLYMRRIYLPWVIFNFISCILA